MADFNVSLVSSAGNAFITQKSYSGSIPAGGAGDILTIQAALGKRCRLDFLTSAPASSEAVIEIYADGVLVNQSTTDLVSSGSPSGFFVSQGRGSDVSGCIQDIVAKEIIVRKTTGTTSDSIRYAYCEGF